MPLPLCPEVCRECQNGNHKFHVLTELGDLVAEHDGRVLVINGYAEDEDFLIDLIQTAHIAITKEPIRPNTQTETSTEVAMTATTQVSNLDNHNCREAGEPSWPEYDAQRIYLCRVCDLCRDAKLSRYRPEILTGYNQLDVDEPIEAD